MTYWALVLFRSRGSSMFRSVKGKHLLIRSQTVLTGTESPRQRVRDRCTELELSCHSSKDILMVRFLQRLLTRPTIAKPTVHFIGLGASATQGEKSISFVRAK